MIGAHRRLREAGGEVDLVLIGPDDDGVKVQGDGISYLGHQPRDIVAGALAECLASST